MPTNEELARWRASISEANACEPFLSNMIRALASMPMLNTPEENERLACARMVKTYRTTFLRYCKALRDSRGRKP